MCWEGFDPMDGQTITLPESHDTKRHDCYLLGCEQPEVCVRVRRLGDMYCVCGARYGFGNLLVFREVTGRWCHASCVAGAAAAGPVVATTWVR